MRIPLVIAAVLIYSCSFAQKSTVYKFAKITEADLEQKAYSIDSNANAVVIADLGISEIVGNSSNWFSLEFTHRKRVHILNKSGYSEGDFEVYLYTDGSLREEKLTSVKGVTYNLENGKVVETKMEKSAVFTDKLDKNHIVKKFTLPNIKEGSIIDIEYKTTSDFLFNLEAWSFQGTVPRLWSEYQLNLPEFLGYIFLSQGYEPYFINERKERNGSFTVSDSRGSTATERVSFVSKVFDFRWVMKDVPELKLENFTSTLRNHIARIEFQLSEYRPPLTYRQIMSSWPEATKEMLQDEDFGKQLSTGNAWLNDDIKPILVNSVNQLDKAKKIFAYVRDNFVCTDHSAIYSSQSLKNVLKSKKGNVADLNLLLVAMLRHEDIIADPVILSTREHGITYQLYPVMNRFNYVTCQATIDGKIYNLDASRPRLGFGKMASDCFNGWARIINEAANAIQLSADSLKERKITSVVLTENKGKWQGSMSQLLGEHESYSFRNRIKEEGEEAHFKKVQKSFGEEAKTDFFKIDSLDNYEAPVSIQYKFTIDQGSEDILYINPLFGEAQKENPFKSADRTYPVEMPYTFDETYVASIYVPEGYEVEELPKQIKVKLNEGDGSYFEYLIGHSGNIISLRSRVKLDRALYQPEEYEVLREFYNLIVKKQGEQIVLKKKK